MADKSFGVTQLDILGSGEPTISAPDRLKLDSHNVAISTSLHVGAATTIGGDLNVSGVSTFSAGGFVDIRRNVSITGIATIAAPYNTNAQVAWTVTNNSASAYRFTGPGQSGSDDNPDLYLVRGQRYIFKHEATSSHPLEIRVANGGAAYNDGVTNNGQHSTNITFNVQHDAPAQLFYQCTSHGGMVGNIYIVGGPQVISGVVTATTFVGNLTGTASANAVLTGSTNNTVCTVTGANAIQGESGLTYNGTAFRVDSITSENNAFRVYNTTTSATTFQINGEGNSFQGHTYPLTDSNLDLGYHATNKWRDVVLSGGIRFGSANEVDYLDDYEEGSFTATIANLNNSSHVVVDHYHYTKIGRRVFISVKMTFNASLNDNSGMNIQIPFTNSGNREDVFSAISTRSGTNRAPFAMVLNANQTRLYAKTLEGFNTASGLTNEHTFSAFAGSIVLISGSYEVA